MSDDFDNAVTEAIKALCGKIEELWKEVRILQLHVEHLSGIALAREPNPEKRRTIGVLFDRDYLKKIEQLDREGDGEDAA